MCTQKNGKEINLHMRTYKKVNFTEENVRKKKETNQQAKTDN